jgi:hypothetical protein
VELGLTENKAFALEIMVIPVTKLVHFLKIFAPFIMII